MPPTIPTPQASGLTRSTDVPLYWAAYGPEEGTPLLVLHGGPGAHHDYLLPQMLALAGERGLVFYDQRGGGRSRTDDREPIGWRTHVEDLARVAGELRIEPLSIVGYSWGGLLALLYAIAAARGEVTPSPARLALIDPAPATRALRDRFEAELARRHGSPAIAAMRDELAASGLRERDPEAYRQRAFELSVAGYFADPSAARDLTPFRVMGRVQKSVWESLGDYDLLAELADLRIPSLVVHGREDPIPLESSVAVARALGARLVVLEESGHVPYVESPTPLFAALARFLRDTESSTSASLSPSPAAQP
ncbi:MAG TPA: alpha/beta fold hydrolase [Gemmatimonadaceae bacterium]|nr:alpha/beta fold hydrolase [Gemmatimonadaceae bacterium]